MSRSVPLASPSRAWALLALRVSLGWLLVVWGGDKLTNVEHAVRVSEGFYLGLLTGPSALQAFGVVQTLAGLLVVLGLARSVAYPFLAAVALVTFLAVWKSIVDPLGLVLEGGNPVFYSSAVILAGTFVLWSFRSDDRLALDARRARPPGA